jgi:hypothetical protein
MDVLQFLKVPESSEAAWVLEKHGRGRTVHG